MIVKYLFNVFTKSKVDRNTFHTEYQLGILTIQDYVLRDIEVFSRVSQ